MPSPLKGYATLGLRNDSRSTHTGWNSRLTFLEEKAIHVSNPFQFLSSVSFIRLPPDIRSQFWTHTAWSSGQEYLDHSQLEAKTRPISVSDWFKPQYEPTITVSSVKRGQTLSLQRGNRCDGSLGIENAGCTSYLGIILGAPLKI